MSRTSIEGISDDEDDLGYEVWPSYSLISQAEDADDGEGLAVPNSNNNGTASASKAQPNLFPVDSPINLITKLNKEYSFTEEPAQLVVPSLAGLRFRAPTRFSKPKSPIFGTESLTEEVQDKSSTEKQSNSSPDADSCASFAKRKKNRFFFCARAFCALFGLGAQIRPIRLDFYVKMIYIMANFCVNFYSPVNFKRRDAIQSGATRLEQRVPRGATNAN